MSAHQTGKDMIKVREKKLAEMIGPATLSKLSKK